MVVIGGSAGALSALGSLLPLLPDDFPLPIVVVLHLHPHQDTYHLIHYAGKCQLAIKEAEEKETIQPGVVYFAPPNYHLLIEDNLTFSLSIDPKVNYSRPSIDVLFESAIDACGSALIGVILTGANDDGARGLRQIKEHGGLVIVQDPRTAESSYMPGAALAATQAELVLSVPEIGKQLAELGRQTQLDPEGRPGGEGVAG